MENKKILLIWDRMGDYHMARYQALEDLLGKGNVYTADLAFSDNLYGWKNPHISSTNFALSKKGVGEIDLWSRIKNFLKIIKTQRIDIVAQSGYGKLDYLLFIIIARIMSRQVIIFAESWYPGNLMFDKFKGLFLRFFVNGFFVSGIRAERHFIERLGVSKERVIRGYSVVDNDHFYRKSPNQNFNEYISDKSKLHPSSLSRYLLCVARYSHEKNLVFLIEAYKKSSLYSNWKLVLIGDGPQKNELERVIGNDKEHILLLGWIKYERLPPYYHNAKALILPSLFEPWGLVINEAMAAGLPVVLSDFCGCLPDLHTNNNGFCTFNPNVTEELIYALNKLSRDDHNYVEENIQKINEFDCKSWAGNLARLMQLV